MVEFHSTGIIPVPSVNAAIINSRGEILLTKRSSKVRAPGFWCLPGGHLEGGESWVDALRRETSEETGLSVLEYQLVGVYSDPELTVTHETFTDGFKRQFLAVLFRVLRWEGQIHPNDEVDELGWYSLKTLPSPLLVSHPIRIHDAFLIEPGKTVVR